MGTFLLNTQQLADPGELLNLSLNAQAVLPEGFVLLALIGTLLVDLAGEEIASKWTPPICYAGLGSSLLILSYQWNQVLEPSFLGAFIADNFSIAFRGVVVLSTLISLPVSYTHLRAHET